MRKEGKHDTAAATAASVQHMPAFTTTTTIKLSTKRTLFKNPKARIFTKQNLFFFQFIFSDMDHGSAIVTQATARKNKMNILNNFI